MSGEYICEHCQELIKSEEYLIYQTEERYHVYHVGCWGEMHE